MKVKPKCQHRTCPPDRCEKKPAQKYLAVFLLSIVILLALCVYSFATPAPRALLSAKAAMSEPQTTRRQLIVDEFIRRLKKIDSTADPLANGYKYQTDIGKTVDADGQSAIRRWRNNINQDELKDASSQMIPTVFDSIRPRSKEFPDQVSVVATLTVDVGLFHYRDAVTADDLTLGMADVEQAIVTDPATGKQDPSLGGLAIDVRVVNDRLIVPNETYVIDGAAVAFEVDHDIEPYAQ